MARVQFVIATKRGAVPPVDVGALEQQLAEAGRTWWTGSRKQPRPPLARPRRTPDCAGSTVPDRYQARTEPAQAIADIARIEAVLAGSSFGASLHARLDGEAADGAPGLRLYRPSEPLVLSDMLPILENLGLRIIAEEPFRIASGDKRVLWIHEFTLGAGCVPAV